MTSSAPGPGDQPRPAAVLSDRLDPLVAELPAGESALVSAASALTPVLSANAETADLTRRLPEETVTTLRKEGLFRLATPRAYGGHEAGACAATAVIAEVGRGCPSASWVLGVYYGAGLALWLFPDEVRQRVWGDDPDATVCGSSVAAVPVREVGGGYLLRGRWGWASGVHHASWAVLDIAIGADTPSPERGIALVPMAELSIEDTWKMTGMRGTGSDTIVAEDVFVPAERVVVMSRPTFPAASAIRLQGLMGSLAAPALGMGMAVYDHIVAKLTEGRPLVSAAKLHPRAIDAPGVQANIADAALLIDSAILHAARTARVVDRAIRAGTRMSPLAAVRTRVDAGYAARQIRTAVDKLLDVGGAGRFAEASPMQRIWRDLGTAIRHPAFATEIDREQYAMMLLGVDKK
jgi:3-hydroxy-9,10-secoandrosta-1,3,5(10)-triene-9,17-dione monooxygenase